MTVWEVAQLPIANDKQDELASVVRSNLSLLKGVDGCLDIRLLQAIDKEGVVLLCLQWESVEHHVAFTQTEAFNTFSAAVGPLFSGAPEMFHVKTVIKGF